MAARTTGVPYESSLGVKPVLVGWCKGCEAYDYPWVKGGSCPGHWDGLDDGHRYVKRRMWICPGNQRPWGDPGHCEFGFLSYRGLLEHQHGGV